MKILLIHNYGQYRGGAETYLESVVNQLKKAGHSVVLYTKHSSSIHTFVDKIKTAIGLFYNNKTARDLELIIMKEQPDVAQILNIYPLISATAYWVIKKHQIPLIQRVQDYRYFCPKALLFRKGKVCELCIKKNFKYPSIVYGCYQNSRIASFIFSASFFFHSVMGSFKKIDIFIFPSKFVREFYIKHAHILRNKTVVIPTFTDISQISKKKLSANMNKYFLFFGRLSEEKGILELLTVFKTLPKIKLTVIGDGPLYKNVKGFTQYKNITIKGFYKRKNILKYIKQAQAVIIPSLWYDVMPNVLIETLTQKIPVIVPRFGVFPELVNKNQGYFYRYGNLVSLKNTIIKVEKIPTPIQIASENRFIPEKHIGLLIDLYKRVIYEK